MELKTDLIVNTNSNHQSSLLLFLQNKIILVQTSLFHHKIENLKNILHHIDYYAKFFSLFRSKWIKVCFISPKEKKTFVCNKCLINTKMKSCCAVFFNDTDAFAPKINQYKGQATGARQGPLLGFSVAHNTCSLSYAA